MRSSILISALLACASAPLIGQATTTPSPSAGEVVARMVARDVQRQTAAGGFTGYREYVLENAGFDKQARMVVSVSCHPDGTENFQVVSEQGWKAANNRVLRKMLESESEISRPWVRPKTRITSDNYAFRMASVEALNGRLAYVIDVTPKRLDGYLFRGRIWVDAEDYALARVDGQPTRNPSFWIRSVHFTHEYRKRGEFWFPWSTTSISETRAFGETKVDIRYFDYFPCSKNIDRETNPQLVEAHYVKH